MGSCDIYKSIESITLQGSPEPIWHTMVENMPKNIMKTLVQFQSGTRKFMLFIQTLIINNRLTLS